MVVVYQNDLKSQFVASVWFYLFIFVKSGIVKQHFKTKEYVVLIFVSYQTRRSVNTGFSTSSVVFRGVPEDVTKYFTDNVNSEHSHIRSSNPQAFVPQWKWKDCRDCIAV